MSDRVRHLDALRGVAVAAVFMQHLLWQVWRAPATPELARHLVFWWTHEGFNLGRFGVVLFFLLSGYVIPLSFRGNRPYFDFFVSRFLRLYPAYWLSVIFAVITAVALTKVQFDAVQFFANLSMVQKLFGVSDVNGVYWSLFIELVFYAACLGLFALGRLTDTKTLVAATIACVAATVLPMLVNMTTAHHLPVQFLTHHLSFLFFGGVIRNAIVDRHRATLAPCVLATAVVLTGIPFASGWVISVNPNHVPLGGEIGIGAAYFAAMGLFVASCLLRRPVGHTFVWLGSLSYAIYVLHGPCITIAQTISPLSNEAAAWIYAGLSTILTLLVAALCLRSIEVPGMALSRRIRFGRRVPVEVLM